MRLSDSNLILIRLVFTGKEFVVGVVIRTVETDSAMIPLCSSEKRFL